MKFEMQKTFDISRRLIKWKSNEQKFNNNGKQAEKSFTDQATDFIKLAREAQGE